MKLTLKTDYSLRVLTFLQMEEKATIKEIAEFYKIKKNHLSVVVNRLSELGYITSTPGPAGGIFLNKSALNISLSEVLIQFEDLTLVECFDSKSNTCRLSPGCKLKSYLHKAQKSFLDELGQYKIKDLV
ncbi:Rrf2 family transcriptional regulator [Bacteriovorax sp. PP10]|uniref:Rrf2 family transcriptional regulator n=1 Tax=Bacteriovorax antarcticus TaxID=3088717 RepID=A0ABU5W005_9BACT|nr:Rrf2 family transcriptional regulator [Bacteriovorax sp. PP10]MEA9357590.1 Rrf2 family transcriptional regulator [Bacteriovorax sp. PP10]